MVYERGNVQNYQMLSVGRKYIMIFENVKVVHKTFGEGTVTEHIGNYITVKFATAEKKFVYPDAFDRFLSLENGGINAEIEADLLASKKAKQSIIDMKNEENHRAMTRGIVIPGKEANQDSEDEEGRNKEHEEY